MTQTKPDNSNILISCLFASNLCHWFGIVLRMITTTLQQIFTFIHVLHCNNIVFCWYQYFSSDFGISILFFSFTSINIWHTDQAPCSQSFSGSGSRSGSSFKMSNFWTISHYLYEKIWFCILWHGKCCFRPKCILFKYTVETINYNKVDPVI